VKSLEALQKPLTGTNGSEPSGALGAVAGRDVTALDGLGSVTATTLHTGVATVERTRKRFVEEGLAAALTERRRLGGQPKLQGKAEAFLIATACSVPPNGRKRWTLQLLADRLMEVGVVDAISDDTVGRTLKKTPLSRG
jgi:hypothetical protein